MQSVSMNCLVTHKLTFFMFLLCNIRLVPQTAPPVGKKSNSSGSLDLQCHLLQAKIEIVDLILTLVPPADKEC